MKRFVVQLKLKSFSKDPRQLSLSILLPSASVLLIVIAVASVFRTQAIFYPQLPPEQLISYELSPRAIAQSPADKPETAIIAKEAYYEVAADQPRRIIIPDLSVEGFIQQVGTYSDGAMAVPANTNVAGWFEKRAKPGEKGLSIINGHLLGDNFKGIFGDLNKLKVGASFQIEMGDRSIRKFVVTSNTKVSNSEAQSMLYSQVHEKQLNLITCIGNYLENEETYDHRQIVVAKLVE